MARNCHYVTCVKLFTLPAPSLVFMRMCITGGLRELAINLTMFEKNFQVQVFSHFIGIESLNLKLMLAWEKQGNTFHVLCSYIDIFWRVQMVCNHCFNSLTFVAIEKINMDWIRKYYLKYARKKGIVSSVKKLGFLTMRSQAWRLWIWGRPWGISNIAVRPESTQSKWLSWGK